MAYTSAEGRQELLDAFAEAIEHIGIALADLGAAYELLDERNGDRLEEELFGPVQRAYGRAKSTYAQFADRHGMSEQDLRDSLAGPSIHGREGADRQRGRIGRTGGRRALRPAGLVIADRGRRQRVARCSHRGSRAARRRAPARARDRANARALGPRTPDFPCPWDGQDTMDALSKDAGHQVGAFHDRCARTE